MQFGHGIQETIGHHDLEVGNDLELELPAPQEVMEHLGSAHFFPEAEDGIDGAEIQAPGGRYTLLDLVPKFKEFFQPPDNLRNLFWGVLRGRAEVNENPLPDFALSGPVGFHDVEGLIGLIAPLASGGPQIHDATIS